MSLSTSFLLRLISYCQICAFVEKKYMKKKNKKNINVSYNVSNIFGFLYETCSSKRVFVCLRRGGGKDVRGKKRELYK